jgi:hypothetical protein
MLDPNIALLSMFDKNIKAKKTFEQEFRENMVTEFVKDFRPYRIPILFQFSYLKTFKLKGI